MPTITRTLTLGHSPDSDDAFMFHGLANHKIDTEGLHFEHILRDIQTLNEWAREGEVRHDCHFYPRLHLCSGQVRNPGTWLECRRYVRPDDCRDFTDYSGGA